MLLTCPKCKTKNFLDPYPFWNFKGKTKCAGCGTVWRLETAAGRCTSGVGRRCGSRKRRAAATSSIVGAGMLVGAGALITRLYDVRSRSNARYPGRS